MNDIKIIMLVGLPASGKSHKARELSQEYDAEIFSSDALREELFGDVNHQDNNHELFNELHRRIKDCLKSGKGAIYDACNISYKRRMAFLQELKNIPCEKICVLMATPYEECLKRNMERERKVPEEVIKRMYMNFTIPYWYEMWDDIQVEYSDFRRYYNKPYDFYKKYKDYNQHNSHHQLTLGEHCRQTAMKLASDYQPTKLVCAGYIHDCGKSECATYVNKKGETTKECHYYGHQYASGYNALFYDYDFIDPLEVAIRVMWHMQPYFNKEEKTINKYKKLWGEELYNDIMLLHKADEAAH